MVVQKYKHVKMLCVSPFCSPFCNKLSSLAKSLFWWNRHSWNSKIFFASLDMCGYRWQFLFHHSKGSCFLCRSLTYKYCCICIVSSKLTELPAHQKSCHNLLSHLHYHVTYVSSTVSSTFVSVDGSSCNLSDAAISRNTYCATLAAIQKFENAFF